MNKKILSVLIGFLLVFFISFKSFTVSDNYIIDECGFLSESEKLLLDSEAYQCYSDLDVGVFFVLLVNGIQEYDISRLVEGISEYIIMVEDTDYWTVLAGGGIKDYLDSDVRRDLRNAFNDGNTYYEGISAYIKACRRIIGDYLNGELKSADPFPSSLNPGRLYDGADLLSQHEEASILERLDLLSSTYQADFIVVTVDEIGNYSADDYIEEFYDRYGYGFGVDHDGVMLLVSMGEREYRILSNGFVADAIGPSEIDSISDSIVGNLSAGSYYIAINTFLDRSSYYVDGHINGFPFNFTASIIVSILIGFIAALISVSVMKSKLKSVYSHDEADDYVLQDSLNVTKSSDAFLYATVSRTRRESSSSRSSSRGRSGGSSRHVGGGKF